MEKFHFLVWVCHKSGGVNNTETFSSQKYWVQPLWLFLTKRMRLNRRQGSKHSAYLQNTSETENNSKSKAKGLFLSSFPRNEQNTPGFTYWQLNISCKVKDLRIFVSLGLAEIISDMHLVCFLNDRLSLKMKCCFEWQCEIYYIKIFDIWILNCHNTVSPMWFCMGSKHYP